MTDTQTRAGNTGPRKAKMNATRRAIYGKLTRSGHSLVAYSIVTEMIFGGFSVEAATVYPDGPWDRSIVINTAKGRTEFLSRDGDWHDSACMTLAAADRSTIEDAWASATGWQD